MREIAHVVMIAQTLLQCVAEEIPLRVESFTWCQKSASKIEENLTALNRIDEGDIDRGPHSFLISLLIEGMEVIKFLSYLDIFHVMDLAQRLKVKWGLGGDENSRYFHGVLNKKKLNLTFEGIMVDDGVKEEVKKGCGIVVPTTNLLDELHLSFLSVVDAVYSKELHLSPMVDLSILLFYADDAGVCGTMNGSDTVFTNVFLLKSFKLLRSLESILNEPADNNFRRSIRGGIDSLSSRSLRDLLITIVLMCYDRCLVLLEGSGEFYVASIRRWRFIDEQRLLRRMYRTLWIKSRSVKCEYSSLENQLDALLRDSYSRRGIEIDLSFVPFVIRG
ncbi:hypothetical protein Tco_0546044 [Tanacetum coccineum]